MKVLYIGHYREGTGWGRAAIDYILSMDAAGIEVVPRAVKLNDRQPELPRRLLELENQESSGCDVCIQHVLPHLMDFHPKFKKNIALYATETSNFKYSTWPRKINLMDEAWVINSQMVEASVNSGVTVPIKVIPHATDFEKFTQRHKKLDLPIPDDNFIFYTVGEFNKRKNLRAFVTAFHLEFERNEPVSILIKTNKAGLNADQCAEQVQGLCNEIKLGLKLYPSSNDYKEDFIITDYLSEKDIERVHQSCDCFVMPSHGEAWCIPAFDAMGFGNTPICTNTGGMADFLRKSTNIGAGGVLVDARLEPVTGALDTLSDIFTGKEEWASIDIQKLRKAMREMYESDRTDMQTHGLERAMKYSHREIGNVIKEALNA